MTETIHLPLLDRIHVASPCTARWEDMTGDGRLRHCAQCDLDVHNLSAMTRDEAEALLQGLSRGRVCARFYKRADGTILTRDCPVGLAAVRRRVLLAASRVAAALGLATLAGAAAQASQDKSWGNWGWSMRLASVRPVQWVVFRLNPRYVPAGLRPEMGDVSSPPLPYPPVRGAGPYPSGPHGWEYRQ